MSRLLDTVLEPAQSLAWAERYDDPPGLAPLPEEEPLVARSVAKRRNEFVTVRYCARLALEELGGQRRAGAMGESRARPRRRPSCRGHARPWRIQWNMPLGTCQVFPGHLSRSGEMP